MSSKLNYAINTRYPIRETDPNLRNPTYLVEPSNTSSHSPSPYQQTTMNHHLPSRSWKYYAKCYTAYSVIFLGLSIVIFTIVFGLNNLALRHNATELNETITIDDGIMVEFDEKILIQTTNTTNNSTLQEDDLLDINITNKTIVMHGPNNTIILSF